MTRRQRAKYFRWIQYAIGIIILIVIAFLADWKAFANAFLNVQVALKMFPEVITTGL
jgi:polar amino acid transport system permease protein